MIRYNPKNVIVWLASSINYLKGCLKNLPLSTLYPLLLTPNLAAHISKVDFPAKVSYWFVLLIRCTKVKSLKMSTITLGAKMRALVSLPNNCGTNTGWSDCSWSTETSTPGLLLVYFLIDPYLLYFVILSFSLLFQTCMMHKKTHHPSILEHLTGGLQVFYFKHGFGM